MKITASQNKRQSTLSLAAVSHLLVFRARWRMVCAAKALAGVQAFLSIYTDSEFICYQLMTDTASGRNSSIVTSYQKCLWTRVSLGVQRPTGQAQG